LRGDANTAQQQSRTACHMNAHTCRCWRAPGGRCLLWRRSLCGQNMKSRCT
jgi:hypothetical protein